jgi:thymidylate synthase
VQISVIEARDLSEAWFLCLSKTLSDGYDYRIERGSYKGQRRKQLDFFVCHIKYPGTRPLIPDVPQGVPAPSTMEYVENYLPYLMTEHRAEGEQYTYGQYLESHVQGRRPQHQPSLHDRRGTQGNISDRPAVFTRHRYPDQKQ